MTPRQARLLVYIADYQRGSDGASPSHEEMAQALGLSSRSVVHYMLVRLEADGRIARDAGRVRSIRVTGPAVTVADFRTAVSRLVEQEGVARAITALLDIAGELAPHGGEAG